MLYCKVAAQLKTKSTACSVKTSDNKCTQNAAALKAVITIPTTTSSTPSADTSNSGVFVYNAEAFGAASDASNDNPIYYFRGVLDSGLTNGTGSGSYASAGNSAYYQNYVILQSGTAKATTDTCWRIFRTTGSGGTKMLYNGTWTGSTCANAQTAAQFSSTSVYDTTADSSAYSIVGVGYTYDATNKSSTGNVAYKDLFGTNDDYSKNTTSDIRI